MTAIPYERLRQIESWLAGQLQIVEPRLAASVVLLRQGRQGLETFLMQRAATMTFAPGAPVFPGGSVSPGDTERVLHWEGPSPNAWARSLGCAERDAAAIVCAAVRETFEEADILFASPAAGGQRITASPMTTTERQAVRMTLASERKSLAAVLNQRAWSLRTDLLRPWSRWVTPQFSPRRYDTHFLVAAVPEGQQASVASSESVRAQWYPLEWALQAFRDGSLPIMLPTAAVLRDIQACGNLTRVLSVRRSPTRFEVHPITTNGTIQLIVRGLQGEWEPEELTT